MDVQQSVISSLTGPWLLSPPASAAEPPRAEVSVKKKQGTEGEVTEAEDEEGASDHDVLKLPPINGQHGGSRADNPFDRIEEESEALEMEGSSSSSSSGEVKAVAGVGDIRKSHQSVKSEVTQISSAYADDDWESFDDGSRRSIRAAEEGIARAAKSAKLGGHRTESVYSHAVDESLDNGIDTSRRDDEAMEEEDIGMVPESPRSTSLLYTDAPTAEEKLDDSRMDTSRDAGLAVEDLTAVSHHSLKSESAKDASASSDGVWEAPGDLNERRRGRRTRSRKEKEQVDDEDITAGAKSARSQEISSHAVDKSLGSSRDEEDTIPTNVLQSRQSAISDSHSKAPLSASGYGDDDWEDMEEDDDHGKAVMEELAQASAPSWRSESHLKQLNEVPLGSVPGTDTGYDDIFGDGQGGDGLWLPDEATAGNSPMMPLAKAPAHRPSTHD